MTWPTVAVTTANLDAATDSPASARADLLDAVTKQNQIMAHVSSFGSQLIDDADPATARATLGTNVYKDVPAAAALVAGECFSTSGTVSLSQGAEAGTVFAIYNNSASSISLVQVSGVLLRLAGTTTTGSRTLAPRGIASVWCLSTTEYIISGAGVY